MDTLESIKIWYGLLKEKCEAKSGDLEIKVDEQGRVLVGNCSGIIILNKDEVRFIRDNFNKLLRDEK